MRLGSFTIIIDDSVTLYGPRLASGTTVWFCDPWNRTRFLKAYPECASRAEAWPLTRLLLASRRRRQPLFAAFVSWLKARPQLLAEGLE